MTNLTLATANALVAGVLAEGAKARLQPLTVAVLDAGGHLLSFQRQDGGANLRPQIAIGKASGALGMGVSSRKLGEMAAERPTFVTSLATLGGGGLVPAAGGVLLLDDEGRVAGALGVSGDSSDNDEKCALGAAAKVGVAVRT